QMNLATTDISKVFLAGAFGNYINVDSARLIGLLDFPVEKIDQAGNTALRGAKLSLIDDREYQAIPPLTKHVSLATDRQFQETFAAQMNFPE
ncbi:MAG: ASKHA domain-containing protein, partial [Candidatus Neomarinimicrobiota bacterium]